MPQTTDIWNDDWREELESDNYELYERLADCRNQKKDIREYAKMIYKYNPSKTKEECLDRAIIWVTDWNHQAHLIPDNEEYRQYISEM